MITMAEAAALRAAQVRAPADRPSQRRNAESGTSFRVSAPSLLSLRAATDTGSGLLEFEGVASTTERGYEMWDMFGPYTEIVSAGAFITTLNRADLDVPLVLGHDQMRRIARTTTGTLMLSEDEQGLRVVAPALDPADDDVAYIARKLDAHLLDEMSFAFRIVRGRWSPDYTEYRIDEVDLHRGDVSIVGWGANPYTWGLLQNSAQTPEARASVRRVPDSLLAFRPI